MLPFYTFMECDVDAFNDLKIPQCKCVYSPSLISASVCQLKIGAAGAEAFSNCQDCTTDSIELLSLSKHSSFHFD
jgi:hypothetical protein